MKLEEPDSKFLEVKCSECGNEQIIFNKPSTTVECENCATVLCKPSGGLGNVETNIQEIYR